MLTTHIVALRDIAQTYDKASKPVLLIDILTGTIMWGNRAALNFFYFHNISTLNGQQIAFSTSLYRNLFLIYRIFKNDDTVIQNDVLDFSCLFNTSKRHGIINGTHYDIDIQKIYTAIRCWQLIDGTEVLELVLDVLKQPEDIESEQNLNSNIVKKNAVLSNSLFQEITKNIPKIFMLFDNTGRCIYLSKQVTERLAMEKEQNISLSDIIPDTKIQDINFQRKYTTYLPLQSQKTARFSVEFSQINHDETHYILAIMDDVEHFLHMRDLLEKEIDMLKSKLDLFAVFSWQCTLEGRFERIEVNERMITIDSDNLFKKTPKEWKEQDILIGDNGFDTIFKNKLSFWKQECVLKLPEIKEGIANTKKMYSLTFFGKKMKYMHMRPETGLNQYYVGVAVLNTIFNDDYDCEVYSDDHEECKVTELTSATIINDEENNQDAHNLLPRQNMHDILLTIKKELEISIDDEVKEETYQEEETVNKVQTQTQTNQYNDQYKTDNIIDHTAEKNEVKNGGSDLKTKLDKNFFINNQQMHDLGNLINQMTIFVDLYNNGEVEKFDNKQKQSMEECTKNLVQLLKTFRQQSDSQNKKIEPFSITDTANESRQLPIVKDPANIKKDKEAGSVNVISLVHYIVNELKKVAKKKQVILRLITTNQELITHVSLLEERAHDFRQAFVELMYYRMKKCLPNSMIMISVHRLVQNEMHIIIKDNGEILENFSLQDKDKVSNDAYNRDSFDTVEVGVVHNLFKRCNAILSIKAKENSATETHIILPLQE